MDKARIAISETFLSADEKERATLLQRAVDRYIRLMLESAIVPEDDTGDERP